MRRSWWRAGGVLPLAAAAALSGCGGSAAPPSAAPSSAAPSSGVAPAACLQATGGAPWHGLLRVRGDRATLDAYDDYFSPSCLVVPAGRAVTLVLTDRGHLPHTLEGAGVPVAASVDAGQTAFVTIPALDRPARLVCGLHEDEQMFLAIVPDRGGGDV